MGDSAIATYGPISSWGVSAVTSMNMVFDYLDQFNADISSWDTSGVTDMGAMFSGASAFNQPLSFDTSSVTGMSSMFGGASAFNQPLSLDTSSVTDMSFMFGGASAFNQPLSLDTSSVERMSSMFTYASAFNQPLSLDTSSVASMAGMFYNANGLSDANKLLIHCAWLGTCSPLVQSSTGACVLQGDCVCSSNYPGGACAATSTADGQYGNDEACEVTFSGPVTLEVHHFSIEWCEYEVCDPVTVDGVQYTGTDGPDGVTASSLSFASDGRS